MKIVTELANTGDETSPQGALDYPSGARKRIRFESLDALRGLASLAVLLAHGSIIGKDYFQSGLAKGYFLFGPFRVHFFFVLSGFLITYLHLADLGRPNAWKAYVSKRFVRIYPLYWLITFAILPAYFLVPWFGRGWETEVGVILASLLLVPHPDVGPPVLGVAWTLRHELLFYVFFGLAIYGGRRFAKILLGGWFAATMAYFIYTWGSGITPGFFPKHLLSRYNLEFAMGGLIAWVLKRKGSFPEWSRLGWAAGVLSLVATSWLWFRGLSTEGVFLGYGLTATLFVIYGVADTTTKWPKALRFLGSASYAVYLVHFPALSMFAKIVRALFSPESVGARFLATICVILAALFMGIGVHLFVERPLVRMLRARMAYA